MLRGGSGAGVCCWGDEVTVKARLRALPCARRDAIRAEGVERASFSSGALISAPLARSWSMRRNWPSKTAWWTAVLPVFGEGANRRQKVG
jgi:hypothetical protein